MIRAARLAAHQKNYEKAISLLDRISEQGRKQLGGGWESWRWSYAASAAVAQFRRGDRSSMNRIITATPEAIRGFVQIAVAQALVKAGDPDSAFDLLTEARKRLAQSSGTEVVDGYFSLMHQYESLAPIDTVNVFMKLLRHLIVSRNQTRKGAKVLELNQVCCQTIYSWVLTMCPFCYLRRMSQE